MTKFRVTFRALRCRNAGLGMKYDPLEGSEVVDGVVSIISIIYPGVSNLKTGAPGGSVTALNHESGHEDRFRRFPDYV